MKTTRLISSLIALAIELVLTGCETTRTVYVTPADITPPAIPRGVTSITGDEQVDILWYQSNESDLAGYRVYSSSTANGTYEQIAEVGRTDHFVDHDVTNGVTYYYAVSAFDDKDNESELSPEDVFDTPRPAGYDVLLYPQSSEPSLAAFDFSRGRRVLAGGPDADIEISYDASNNALFVDAANADVDIQDFGYTKTLDDLDWAPAEGWSKLGWCELILGHTYAVWTADDHYAKFRVTQRNASSVLVDWAYQIAVGNPELKPAVVNDSTKTLSGK